MSYLTGHCLCGQVQYQSAPALLTLICHCTHCRRQSGSAYSVNVIVPAEALEVAGRIREYTDFSDTGSVVSRGFCPECGSSIATRINTHEDLVIIKGGTLDDPTQVQPAAEIYCERALDWTRPDPDRRFPLGATSTELFA